MNVTQPDIRQSLIRKLNPNRFTAMSGKMAALVGCIVGERFTDTTIEEICVTSDDWVLAQNEGDCGYNAFIGAFTNFHNNWTQLLDVAGLTPEERELAESLFRDRVRRV